MGEHLATALKFPQPEACADDPWARRTEVLAAIEQPVFPAASFDIRSFGALAGGGDCTASFAAAIAACHAAGGGRVLVPEGEWMSGAIHLKSNVNLHLLEGAVIRFSRDPKAYLPMVLTRWEGTELLNYSSFIYAFEQSNVAITGHGVLDGQADADHWWNWDKLLRSQGRGGARHALHQMNDDKRPVGERMFGEGAYLRPNLITLFRCRQVLIEDVTLLRSPMWQIHPLESSNVTIRGVTMEAQGPNTDGCDPESCWNVLIEDCRFNTGNDCIAIKSGRNDDGRKYMIPSRNLVIRRCHFQDGHGGVTLGSEIAGGVSNVFIEDCAMDSPNLRYALRIKNNARRGGQIEHVYCRRITIGQVYLSVLRIDFHYEEGPNGTHIPSAHHLELEELSCARCPRVAEIHGFDRALIGAVRLRNCDFANVARPSIIENAPPLILENVRVNAKLVARV